MVKANQNWNARQTFEISKVGPVKKGLEDSINFLQKLREISILFWREKEYGRKYGQFWVEIFP